jgi:hypothetical protein
MNAVESDSGRDPNSRFVFVGTGFDGWREGDVRRERALPVCGWF